MESRAIVILYSGKETPAAVIEAIGNTLVVNGLCIPELLQIKVLDADSVANAVVARTVASDAKQQNEDENALEHAMKFLSTTFENEIRIANGSDALGICVLDRAVRKCISNLNYGFIKELHAALEIIKSSTMPRTLCKAHGWSLNVWKVFKQAAEGYV
jgi:hypothetical protein